MITSNGGEGLTGHGYGEGANDWLEPADLFWEDNPALAAQMRQFADRLLNLMDGDQTTEVGQVARLSDALPNSMGGTETFPGSAGGDPLFGQQLMFNRCVSELSEGTHYAEHVSPFYYSAVQFPGYEEATLAYEPFGLFLTENRGLRTERQPEYALAISRDRKHAAIVSHVSDEEIFERSEERVIDSVAALARSKGEMAMRDVRLRLDGEVRSGLSKEGISERVLKVARRILGDELGDDALAYLRASDSERLKLDPVYIPDRTLYSIREVLNAK